MSLSLYEGKHDILIDVYAWAVACEEQNTLVIEGIFRHADKMCRRYSPTLCVIDGETYPQAGVNILEDYLKMPVKIVGESFYENLTSPTVWVSLAVDFPNPKLPDMEEKLLRATILHDTLCLDGHFGKEKEAIYKFGALNNDLFLSVSEESTRRFREYMVELSRIPFIIAYGCPHSFAFDTVCWLPQETRQPSISMSYSVGSIYPRKNLFYMVDLATSNQWTHNHIGQFKDEDEDSFLESIYLGELQYYGSMKDSFMRKLATSCQAFLCLSEDEGFSMTPMEAILMGVPYVIISDIAVHREIYYDLSVNFLDLDTLDLQDSYENLFRTDLASQQYLFQKYQFETLIEPFENYIDNI